MATYAGQPSSFYASTGGKPVEGAWYSGRRYLGGQLLAPGEYEPGKVTSAEVIAQTAPENVAYITQERAKVGLPPPPSSADQVNPYLSNLQNSLFNASTAPEVKIPTMEELKTQLQPTTPLPEPLERVARFEELRLDYGVAALEESLNTIKDQVRREEDLLREQRGLEEGKTVPLGVIQGRITEEERQANVRLDALGRQQSRIVDELNTKYNVINLYMQLESLDYNDAVDRYEKEFTRNLQMYDIIAGARREARSAFESDRDAARANLQIYANAAISGNVDYNSLSSDQKLMISKLEIQAGLPVGFISSVKKDPGADILFTTSNEGITQIGFRNADGTVRVESYGTRISSGTISDTKALRNQFDSSATIGSGNTFPDLVEQYAPVMSLEEIYQAYANSEMGKQYGSPKEDTRVLKLVYDVARGNKTEEEARYELEL